MTPTRKPVHLRPDRALSEAEAVDLAGPLKALAEPSRLQILALVRDRPGASAKAIVPHLDVDHPTALHHVWKLDWAGLLDVEKVGGALSLTVDLDAMHDVATAVRGLANG